MRILIASSGVGLGHVVRDVHLAEDMRWADLSWITCGTALRYLKQRELPTLSVSYHLRSFDPVVKKIFSTGTLRLGTTDMLSIYRVVRGNVKVLRQEVPIEEFDGVVADEFWEFLVSGTMPARTALITDFFCFKPQQGSLTQRLVIPLVNGRLQKAYRKLGCRVYVGLNRAAPGFEYYGQIFSHEAYRPSLTAETGLAVVNIGGTWAGKRLLHIATEASKSLGLRVQVLGPGPHFDPRPLDLVSSAEVLITMAGYSSIVEVGRFRKRAVIVPLGGDFEQLDNAQAFLGREGYRVLPMDQLSCEKLRQMVFEVLQEEPDPPLFQDGSQTISARLRAFFEG